MKKILIVDDNQDVLVSLKLLLKVHKFQPICVELPEQAMDVLALEQIDLVIQDMNFKLDTTSGREGIDLLQQIKSNYNSIPVLLFSAWSNIDLVVEGMKNGATDFFIKPWENAALILRIKNALQIKPLTKKVNTPRSELDKLYDFSNIIGESALLVEQLETVGMISNTTASALIRGENGTGKDLIANAIHINSSRNKKPFVKVNIAGLSKTLFDSEMFGHVKGAFTDAREDRIGRFEQANNGTIFLDEIGDLSLESQVKLLRVIQDGKFERLGSSKTVEVDVRIVSATNINLEEAIEKGLFREDLYYRLNTIELTLPPLRERGEDKFQLANYFVHFYSEKYGKPVSLNDQSNSFIRTHKWNGNIRELQHAIERSVLMAKNGELSFIEKSASSNDQLPDVGSISLEEIEKQMILKTLKETDNHISNAAELLGINRTSLYRRLEKYNIEV